MNDALVTDNIGLVHHYARQFAHRHDYEDIISAGIVGLVKAAAAYKPDACAFSTQATMRIKSAVLTYINRLSPTVRGTKYQLASDCATVVSLDLSASDSDSDWSLIDTLVSNTATASTGDALPAVKRIVESATDITPGQRSALLKIVAGASLSHVEQTNLCHFRRRNSVTARKIKEILHAQIAS